MATRSLVKYKLVFFSPSAYTQGVLHQLFARFPDTVGKEGLYRGCAFVSRGTGQFVPQEGASPAIGAVGQAETVEEDRVEISVRVPEPAAMAEVLDTLKSAHPYEEVVYDIYKTEAF
ncbi:uncharacterized protein SCHCODRAFT_02507299 [Schizophyllum commune H4-8]|uniref:ATP phosphoribosyltransferase n=1 Tax=Schizophyllum commune (strain H4-8 / FGSC 9210) TaxID=578458 RepID=D8QAG3_SCHCM|nr:uncharacterized protein SCHCODRAFT_02507299 [Schizophyllum commune H4-8]KAI5890010.1 hypothetical protein SCHCODRAFT_02507299 [Schizophyllum commune H4-8]